MIDTDKYEGHTPAPWELMRSGPLRDDAPKDLENWWVKLNEARAKTSSGEWMRNIGNSYMTEADAQLIADAPLLLAEVKRLQHAMIYVSMKIFWNENGIPYEYTQLMEYCRQHCGEPDDMSGKLGQMISEFEDEFPYQEESE